MKCAKALARRGLLIGDGYDFGLDLGQSTPPGAIEADILRRRRRSAAHRALGRNASARAERWPVLGGRGEFIEKYFEVAGDLLARGFGVAAMDWRGQGGSERPLRNRGKGHVDDFSRFRTRSRRRSSTVLEPHCPRRGSGSPIRWERPSCWRSAEAGRCPFERLVLTSPMIAVKGVNHRGPRALSRRGARRAGPAAGAFAPGDGPEEPLVRAFRGQRLHLRSGAVRPHRALVAAAPDLRLGGPTIGWAHAAFRAMTRFDDPSFRPRTATPILIVASGADRVTDTAPPSASPTA